MKVKLHSIRFSSVFFYVFASSVNKYVLFHPHFYKSIPALTKLSHSGQKLSEKIFCSRVQPYFEILLLSFIRKVFEQNFYQYETVYLVRIWTYKNADEKEHTCSRKKQKHKKKTDEKRILCKFTLSRTCDQFRSFPLFLELFSTQPSRELLPNYQKLHYRPVKYCTPTS